uniref:Bm12928 n=1 Tax=Brugia malayi TaxID=6279 RepID=A0A0J9Y575_BRUMA|nr:Bm12928 [Brugia malayi]
MRSAYGWVVKAEIDKRKSLLSSSGQIVIGEMIRNGSSAAERETVARRMRTEQSSGMSTLGSNG